MLNPIKCIFNISPLPTPYCPFFSCSGSKTGPEPTAPQPNPPTTTDYPDPEPTDEPTTTSSTPVDPTKDACKETKFDTITVIEGELHFFKDG